MNKDRDKKQEIPEHLAQYPLPYKEAYLPYFEYAKTLPLSKEILEVFQGGLTTHEDLAENFNRIGNINQIIIKHGKEKRNCS